MRYHPHCQGHKHHVLRTWVNGSVTFLEYHNFHAARQPYSPNEVEVRYQFETPQTFQTSPVSSFRQLPLPLCIYQAFSCTIRLIRYNLNRVTLLQLAA